MTPDIKIKSGYHIATNTDIRSQAIAYLRDIGILSDGFTYDELTGVYTILTTDFKTKINELLSI